MSSVEYNLLYSVYSLPNLVFPIIGGLIMDKFGARPLVFLSTIFVTAGQAIFAFGVSVGSFPLALLGRGVFGCGGENLDLGQSFIDIAWFEGRELSMAFGLGSAISMLAIVFNDNSEPVIADETNVDTGLWFGFLICVGSFIAALIVIVIDRRRDRLLGIKNKSERPESEKFKFKDIKEFDKTYWILLINCITSETSVYCFEYIASGFFQDRFGYSSVEAGFIMSTTFFIAALSSPIIGFVTDRYGKRMVFLISSGVFSTLFHISFMIIPDTNKPIYPLLFMILLGLSYSIYNTVYWAALTYIVDSKLIGTAMGTSYVVSNLGLILIPPLIGYIQDTTHLYKGYFWVSFCLALLGFLGVLSGIWVHSIDMKNGGILHSADPVKAKNQLKLLPSSKSSVFVDIVN